ncbi:hypothetical protein SUDANB178_00542 [Streptomyces sp. enrichment culture]
MSGLAPCRGGTGLAVAVARHAALGTGPFKTLARPPGRRPTMSAFTGPALPAAPARAARLTDRARPGRPAGAARAGFRPAGEYG